METSKHDFGDPLPITPAEALAKMAERSVEMLATAPEGGISMWHSIAKDQDGKEQGMALIACMGLEQANLVLKHMKVIEEEAKKQGLGGGDRMDADVESVLASIIPKEDARGCRKHQKFADCQADHRNFVRNCWRPLYAGLAGLGVSFERVKDTKGLKHVMRSIVCAGLAVGQKMAKDGCRGFLGSKYRP
jgi:hypothetical protein